VNHDENPCPACDGAPPLSDTDSEFSRRTFLQLLAAGAGVAFLHGCGAASTSSQNATAPGSTANPIGAIVAGNEFVITGGGALKNGQALAFRLPDQSPGIVFVTNNGELRALSSKCTHMGCTVEWQTERDDIKCPCHGSRFDVAGKVLNGPATKPLAAFKVRKQGEDALISKT
jgi:cytochrome b6-f complex iron-sulfur subunit